jgi:hypothetical protein
MAQTQSPPEVAGRRQLEDDPLSLQKLFWEGVAFSFAQQNLSSQIFLPLVGRPGRISYLSHSFFKIFITKSISSPIDQYISLQHFLIFLFFSVFLLYIFLHFIKFPPKCLSDLLSFLSLNSTFPILFNILETEEIYRGQIH